MTGRNTRTLRVVLAAGAVVVVGLAVGPRVHGFVEKMFGLQEVIDESEVIALGEVSKVDVEHKTSVIRVTEVLRGNCPYKKIKMNISVGQMYFPETMMKHLVVGSPVVIFYQKRDAELPSLVYLNQFFFQIYGQGDRKPSKAWWRFTHIEIRMNRTFNGSVYELIDIVREVLAGKRKAPKPDASIEAWTREQLESLPTFAQRVRMPDLVKLRQIPPLLEQGRLGVALAVAERFVESRDEVKADEARRVIDALDQYAADRLDMLARMKRSDPVQALEGLTNLAKEFSPSTMARELLAQAREWQKEPATVKALKAAAIYQQMVGMADRLREKLDGKKVTTRAMSKRYQREIRFLSQCVSALKRSYPDTPSCRRAVMIAQELGIKVPD